MNKLLRLVVFALAGLVLMLVAAAVILPMVVDPNDYKDRIAAMVEEQTGRNLTIEGDIGLSVFPWLGFEVGPVSLANASGFSAQPFASVQAVDVRIKLLPLLTRKVEMDTVVLRGLKLSLETDPQGRTNWEDLAAGADTASAPGAGEAPDERSPSAAEVTLAGLAIGGVEITDAGVVWDDRKADVRYEIDGLSLRTGAIAPGAAVPVELKLALDSTQPPVSGPVSFAATVALSDDGRVIRVSGAELGTDLEGEGLPGGRLQAVMGFDSALDLQAQSLVLENLRLVFDDSTLTGKASVTDFASPAIRFTLALDRIDIDRYLPPGEEPAAPVTPTTAAAAGAQMIPVETLRALNLAGKLTIGELKAAQLRSQDIRVELKAKNGVLRVHPAEASMYQGSYKGDIRIDVRGKLPKITMDERLTGVQVGPLLKDLTGKDSLSGTTRASARLTTTGQTPEQFTRALNGTVDFAFTDGAVEGFNLAAMIRRAQATLNGQPAPADTGPNRTDFSSLTGTATITNGVVDNQDLLAKSPLLRVAGAGTVDLPAQKIDYLVKAKIVGTLEGQGGKGLADLKGVEIPIRVSGTFAEPKYRIQLDQAVRQKAEKKLKKKLEKKFGDKLKGLFQ